MEGFGSTVRLAFARYAGAVLCVAAGLLLGVWLEPLIGARVPLLMAVLIAAWFSGLGPALVASVIATLAFDYFFTPSPSAFTFRFEHVVQLAAFSLMAALFASVSAARRAAERSLMQARDTLEVRVRERTADLTRANAEAVAAQQRFRDLMNSIEGIVWEADARSIQSGVIRFLFVSQQAERVLGFPVERWLAEPAFWQDHIHPDDREWAVDFCVRATREKRNHDFEYRMIAADGRIVWLKDLVNVVVEDDQASALRGVMIDITARKQAEDALREQAELLNLTHDSVFVRDLEGVIRYWNRGAEELYGWSSQEAIGRISHHLNQTVFPVPQEAITEQLLRTGRWEGELLHTRRDGSTVAVASRWSLQRDAHGRPVSILETNNDISERKRAEDKLRESERRHRHIFQATGVSIWEQDFSLVKTAVEDLKAGGVRDVAAYCATSPEFVDRAMSLVRIVDVNDVTLTLFGARSKEELLVSLHTVFTPETRDVFAGELVAIAEGRSSFEGEAVLQKLTGEKLVALLSVSFPPRGASLDTVLVSVVDITDRKRAERELEELAGRLIDAQEQERRRIGRELHDISQMLGVVTIKIDQLRADRAIAAPVGAALEQLRQRTAEITDDVHRLSHRLHSSTLDYLGLMPALQKLVTEFSARHGISIEFAHSTLPALLPSDVALCLFRVTEESLTNVAKHSRAQSARVSIAGRDDGIRLAIEDSGTGFDVKGLESGAGLGFVSMRERLRVLRGTLRVDSVLGRGTRIDAWIPSTNLHPGEPDHARPPARTSMSAT